jgi:predicted nucleotide-binding protein (sugar kinase/HSP70/actin superfamily)
MTRKVAFPVLGELSLLAEKYLSTLGVDVITPPPVTRRTLDIGVQNTPEGLCIPCKLLFGNYLEAAKLGATDIIMLGGPNTCRLGYTVTQHAEQLSKKGYDIRPCPFDLSRIGPEIIRVTRDLVPLKPVQELVGTLRYIMDMFNLVDEARQVTFYIRPRELERGSSDQTYTSALQSILELEDHQQLQEKREQILDRIWNIEHDPDRQILRIGVVGDIYTILTPFLNHKLDIELGRMGVEVWSGYRFNVSFAPLLPLALRQDRRAQVVRAGHRYLERDVGGFARSTIGEASVMAEEEVDGLIHVSPFNCTPEMVAQSALVKLQREKGMPVLNLTFDEQTGRAGMMTRLEALIDMLWSARRNKKQQQGTNRFPWLKSR